MPAMPGHDANRQLERTLLLTDVCDSTRMVEQLGDVEAAGVWARHDALARGLLVRFDGREIDKTDGFLFLFDEPDQAAAYALAYHEALGGLSDELGFVIAARAGLHVGTVVLRSNPPEQVARGAKPLEVEGIAKPVAARTMSVAGPGQTLITAAARDALGEPHRVVSHGWWRLKGVAEPVELLELGDATVQGPSDTAKATRVVQRDGLWLPVREVPHALPRERDRFVGRTSDLRTLAAALSQAPLVSLVGTGGAGKTRLALRHGWSALADTSGGVWFCDLSEARTVDGICGAVAATVGIELGPRDAVRTLGRAIASRGPTLVILDNFEQVAEHADATLGCWSDLAPDARFLVTTREVLGLPGERTVALPPLDVGDAVALFLTRARAVRDDFEAHEDVTELVQLLDQLPLAIELAAARVRVMSAAQLLARMSDRFRLLTRGGRRRDRQATLRATLDWSWDLLDDDERRALAQLTVFEGGFTLEAAEAVLELDELWATDAVQALVDKSLVRALGGDRFDLLVSVQAYASEKLDERATTEARHGAWAGALPGCRWDGLAHPDGDARLAHLRQERDNLYAAASRPCVSAGDRAACFAGVFHAARNIAPAAVVRLGEALRGAPELSPEQRGEVLVLLGAAQKDALGTSPAEATLREAAEVLADTAATDLQHVAHIELGYCTLRERRGEAVEEAILARSDLRPFVRSRAAGLRGLRQMHIDARAAVAAFELAVSAALAAHDTAGHLVALGNLGIATALLGDEEGSLRLCLEAAEREEARGAPGRAGIAYGNAGVKLSSMGRHDEAEPMLRRALDLCRRAGNAYGEAYWLLNLGDTLLEQGRLDEAGPLIEASGVLARSNGDRALQTYVLFERGLLHRRKGELAQAAALYDEGLAAVEDLGLKMLLPKALAERGQLAVALGRRGPARAFLERARAARDAFGDQRDETLRTIAALEEQLAMA